MVGFVGRDVILCRFLARVSIPRARVTGGGRVGIGPEWRSHKPKTEVECWIVEEKPLKY